MPGPFLMDQAWLLQAPMPGPVLLDQAWLPPATHPGPVLLDQGELLNRRPRSRIRPSLTSGLDLVPHRQAVTLHGDRLVHRTLAGLQGHLTRDRTSDAAGNNFQMEVHPAEAEVQMTPMTVTTRTAPTWRLRSRFFS